MSLDRENAGGIVPSFASMDLNRTPLDVAVMNLPRPADPPAPMSVMVSSAERARIDAVRARSIDLARQRLHLRS